MPTIDELAPATAASDTDEVPVSQSGVARKLTRAQFLAGVQPQIALPAGALIGRTSAGTGIAETISIGANLQLSAGTLSASAAPYVIAALPAGTVPSGGDLVPLSQSGANTAVTYTQFMAGISGLSGIGSMATQSPTNVAITGGAISGLTTLNVPGTISTSSNPVLNGADLIINANNHGVFLKNSGPGYSLLSSSGSNVALFGASGAPVWSFDNGIAAGSPLFVQVPLQAPWVRTGTPTYTLAGAAPAAGVTQGLDIGISYKGTLGNTEPYANAIYVASDTLNSDKAPINLSALKINYQYGGTGTTGGRTGLRIVINPIGSVGGSNPFQVGAEIFSTSNVSFGGTDLSGGARGQIVPMNPVGRAYSGATNLVVVSGLGEINMSVDAGASAAILNGFQISRLNSDAGTVGRFRAMMFAGTQTPAGATNTIPDMDYGVVWGHDHHQWSFGASSRMIGWIAQAPGTNVGGAPMYPSTLGWGVDLWGVNIVNQAWRSTGFQVDGTGAVSIGTARLSPSPLGLSISAGGQFVSSTAVNAAGAGYQIGEYLYGSAGDIYAIAALSGTGVSAVTIVAVGYANTPSTNPVAVSGGSGLGATLNLGWTAANGVVVGGPSQKIGFYGAPPIARPSITGSRAGNTALASIVTALSAFGLITDSTTP